MQKYTTYSVAFPTSGVTLKGRFSPQPGLTAVVGPNGVGKTFTTIELTRYLLYGKKALRGKAADYANLDAEGLFTIRDADYLIKRGPKREEVFDSLGNKLASGADAVTAKMTELMGYGLDVFDIANASVQKEADIFGHMLPSVRKQKIDQVVGVMDAEASEKACRTEASVYKREAEALSRQLREPVAPPDEQHRDPEVIEAELWQGRMDRRAFDLIEGQIREVTQSQVPTKARPLPAEIEALKLHERTRQQNVLRFRQLGNIMQRAMKLPSYTEDQLNAARERLQIRRLLENELACPHCGESFVPGHGHIQLPEGPDLTQSQIDSEAYSLRMKAEYDEAYAEQQQLPEMADRSDELGELMMLDDEWSLYEHTSTLYARQIAENATLRAQLAQLPRPLPQDTLDLMADELTRAKIHAAAVERFAEDTVQFSALSAEITEKLRLADEFKKGAEALGDARATLKANLAPIMSRIASELLTDMTHGKLSSVIVDEDMEITVNGQRLETLSGGGETVANIALRIALGQTLVARTFPVFFGDEMDADADDVRREAVTQALKTLLLRGHLRQVILITHRGVDVADHVVDLGNTE